MSRQEAVYDVSIVPLWIDTAAVIPNTKGYRRVSMYIFPKRAKNGLDSGHDHSLDNETQAVGYPSKPLRAPSEISTHSRMKAL